EEAQRDPPDGAARSEARGARRDRLGPRHRRAAHRRERSQRAAQPGALDARDHALSAAARAHRARPRARALGRPHRAERRQVARLGARGEGLRRAGGRMGDAAPERHWTELFAAESAARAGEPGWLEAARKAAIARFAELGLPTRRSEEWKYTNPAPIAK